MVTRFPSGAQPHKPAAPAPQPAPQAPKSAEPVKDDGCTCGGHCGGSGKATKLAG